MPKFFEYDNPGMAEEVNKLIEIANIPSPDVKSDPTIYANNNRDKPFAFMTAGDMNHRYALGDGGGKDHFVVAKYRKGQKELADTRDRLDCNRDDGGNFHVSIGQVAQVAKIVLEERKKMSYIDRIKEALSFSKKAREKRKEKKVVKKVAEGLK